MRRLGHLKVDLRARRVVFSNVFRQSRHVVAAVRLRRNVEVVRGVLGELGEKLKDQLVVEGSSLVVSNVAVSVGRCGVREPHAHGLLYKQVVGSLVPRVRVLRQGAVSVRAQRALLRHEAEQSRAAGATVGPQCNRRRGCVTAIALGKPIEVLGVLGFVNGQVTVKGGVFQRSQRIIIQKISIRVNRGNHVLPQ